MDISCEYIWEAGVGFANHPNHVPQHDSSRTEILKLLLTCFSETIYIQPVGKFLSTLYINSCAYRQTGFYNFSQLAP